MAQYKTVAGPAELWAKRESDREEVVEAYAQIINYEAFGGWKLHLIHQIPVKRRRYYTIVIGAILGIIIGLFITSGGSDAVQTMGLIVGAVLGIILGLLASYTTTIHFNMLVFVKDDDQKVATTTNYDED